MKVTWREKRFVCDCRSGESGVPRAAGFLWDNRRREWWSRKPEDAEKLKHLWDDRVKKVFEVIAERRKAIEGSRATDAAIDIPAPGGLQYLPYQKAGVAFCRSHQNILLADEMGLGKTIQAIGLMNLAGIRRALIVCPATLKGNWRAELNKWLVDDSISIGIAQGAFVPRTDVVIINYDILERHREALAAETWPLLVVDESHFVKNSKAKRTKALFGGETKVDGRRCRWRAIPAARKVFITGTPIVNRPAELWTLIHALDPERWSNWKAYVERYCAAQSNSFGMDTNGGSRLDELQRILRATIMVRRLKADVLMELPPKMRQVIEIPAIGKMAELVAAEGGVLAKHKEQLLALQDAIARAAVNKDEGQYREAVKRLRNSAMVDFSELSRMRHETALAKLPYVIDHVQQCLESVPKIVLFAHHRDVLLELYKAFGPTSVLLFGDTPMAARQSGVQRFQSDPRARVFIGGIIPAGVGITLTAASHVVFAELDWVPGNMTQAEDRCHRIGQRDSVLVQHLVLAGSLDAHMAQVIIRKQEVIEQALDVTDDDVPRAAPAPERPKEITRPAAVPQIRVRAGEQGRLF